MQIHSSGTASLALTPPPPPGGLNLPLWVVIARTDLHDLFLRFASQVYESADITNMTADFDFQVLSAGNKYPPITSGLCRMIYYGWLKEFVTSTTTITSSGDKSTSSVYNSVVGSVPIPPVSDSTSLISLLKTVLAVRPACRLYVLIGTYHFVIWCLSKNVDSGNRIDASVVDYVKQELAKHFYHDRDVNDDVVWTNPVAFPPNFADAFKPDNSLRMFEFGMRPIMDYLEFKKAKTLLSGFSSAPDDYKYATRAALCSFIKRARELLADTVHEETKAVLEAIDTTLMADYTRARVLALGGGYETYGFMGLRNFGILFFDYELDSARSKGPFDSDGTSPGSVDYLGIQTSAAYEAPGRDASSIFLTHIGMDQNFNSEFSATTNPATVNTFIPYVVTHKFGVGDRLISHETLYAVHNGRSRLEPGGAGTLYNPSDSSLSVGGGECTQLSLSTNRPSPPATPLSLSKQQEELGFFIMTNKVPPAPPDATASTYWLLADNEFYDGNKVADLFQGNPSALTDLDGVLDKLLLVGDFEINVSLNGDGIGSILDATEAPSSWQTIVKATSQSDLPKVKTKAVDNDQKRHARGTISCFNIGDHHALRMEVIGFASPVRCTWKTKYPYPPNAYSKMNSQVGNYVKDYDLDDKGDPWYNGALSSFRAFGLLKGIIEALKAQAAARIPNSSASIVVALNSIISKVDNFLGTKAAVGIKTRANGWVQKNGEDLIINNAVFTDVTTP
jgi:hypothetical protein